MEKLLLVYVKLKLVATLVESLKFLKLYLVSIGRRFDPRPPAHFPKKYNNYRFSVRAVGEVAIEKCPKLDADPDPQNPGGS